MANKHYLSSFLKHKGYIGDLRNFHLKRVDISSARMALMQDKNAFFLNAILSFASCINSINRQNYSWAFINSYYTLFYLSKSLLADKNIAIIYSEGKPYEIKVIEGENFKKVSGNSHELALKLFKSIYSHDFMLSNSIDELNPIDWFKQNRELINYRLNPMCDPQPPIELYAYNSNLRKWLTTYISDSLSYSFSKQHAYVAFIFNLINRELTAYEDEGRKNDFLTPQIFVSLR